MCQYLQITVLFFVPLNVTIILGDDKNCLNLILYACRTLETYEYLVSTEIHILV